MATVCMQRTRHTPTQAPCILLQSLWASIQPAWLIQWAMSSWCPSFPLAPTIFQSPFLWDSQSSKGSDWMGTSNLAFPHNVSLWVSILVLIYWWRKPLQTQLDKALIDEYSRISLRFITLIFDLASCVWFYPRCVPPHLAFMWVLGIWIQVFVIAWQVFYKLGHSVASVIFYLIFWSTVDHG